MNLLAQRNIQHTLGIMDTDTHHKYLGLPTLVERNKKRVFNNVKDKVWNRLRGWKNNLVSQ